MCEPLLARRLPGAALPYRFPPSPASLALRLKPQLNGFSNIRRRLSFVPTLRDAAWKRLTLRRDDTIRVLGEPDLEFEIRNGDLGRHPFTLADCARLGKA